MNDALYILAMKLRKRHLPKAVQPGINGTDDDLVLLSGVSVVEGVHDGPWKFLIGGNAHHDVPLGLQPPK